MKISSEFLNWANFCVEGYQRGASLGMVVGETDVDDCVIRFENSGEHNYAKFLRQKYSEWLMLKEGAKEEKYHVFNPMTGQHTIVNSYEEAISLREKYYLEYLENSKKYFSILKESVCSTGHGVTKPLDVSNLPLKMVKG